MDKKVLIANRGEIALRIMRSCQQLKLKTVAIYSEADATAPHVQFADEAYCVGPPAVAQSYLNIDRILAIAQETGSDAIHPGYGLLSENPQFAQRCQDAGLIFIGPRPEVIAKMGGKLQARAIMQAAGIPVVPGGSEAIQSFDEAKGLASQIGYPMMVKASAGGGGIGMQKVTNDQELAKAMQICQGKAKAYFGDSTIYLEKLIPQPRHIEVQILADHFGNVIHLHERECSIQRRHQKVIEEAPSTFLDAQLRAEIGATAIRAAKAINYTNAGTVEFLMDEQKNYYFLEMNTRLQVEHPVTEMITEFDLVQEQIQIAFGKKLTETEQKPPLKGHAIECRIYAEDPQTMLPSPGKITSLKLPQGAFIRNDCGVAEDYTVTPYYDPMLSKLITWGRNREEALTKMISALEDFQIQGVKVNIPLLQKIVTHPKFLSGEIHTHFIEEILGR